MGTTIEDWQSFRRAGDKHALAIRIISYGHDIDNMALIGGPGPTPWLYDDKLRMVGVKLYLDGALGSRGAWLKARSEEHTSELQSLMRISYAVFCLTKKKNTKHTR